MSIPTGTFEIGRDGPGVLVVGLDGTDPSRDALAYAVGMARREGSSLVIVRVGVPVSAAAAVAAASGTVLPPGGLMADEALTPENISALDELLPGRWRLVECTGEPGAELERVARDVRADAIVVGRSRNPGRHLLGSVTSRLVRRANHPVIVVP
ncbi:MAG: universal stress protein [Acidimicrobiaceae bacterium]|nr:universal stress protein [Acidimicrobiaceae bacterium]